VFDSEPALSQTERQRKVCVEIQGREEPAGERERREGRLRTEEREARARERERERERERPQIPRETETKECR